MPHQYRYPHKNAVDFHATAFSGFQVVEIQPAEELREVVLVAYLPTLKQACSFRDGYNSATGGKSRWAEIRRVVVPSTARNPQAKRRQKVSG